MKLGVSGHRRRDGANWDWVRDRMMEIIIRLRTVSGYTSLAPGADQIFADILLERGLSLVAVVPVFRGRIELEEGEKDEFDRLCEQARKVIRINGDSRDEAFLRAGRHVVKDTDHMIFVWDGAPSHGLGGTADIVAYARARRRKGIILDPIRLSVGEL